MMKSLESLKSQLTAVLCETKAYNLPALCVRLGLAPGDEKEAYASKGQYVKRRIQEFTREQSIALAKMVIEHSTTYGLQEALDHLTPPQDGAISPITRRHVLDVLNDVDSLAGNLPTLEFLNRLFPTSEIPYTEDFRCRNLEEGICQHMLNNPDWGYDMVFACADVLNMSERRFRYILEQVVHPEVRTGEPQRALVASINPHLLRDGFELASVDQTSGYPIYRIIKKGGVLGHFKNLIFAANGPKPELVLVDALNNDIQIVRNQDHCLVYDRPIGVDGLRWKELVDWWGAMSPSSDPERDLYRRLAASLSDVEKRFFKYYFEALRDHLKENLPALIPQVYLHYDPYTLRQLPNGSALARQRMDFLILLPHRQRIVIEIDGKQHYSDGDTASPKLYAAMVSEDRNLRLLGYEVYRFGGFELQESVARETVSTFLKKLLGPMP